MGGGFLGINPFILGTGFQSLAGVVNKELPKMTNVTNGFASSMKNMSEKFQDFKVNAIEPVVEATKTFGEQIIPQIGIALRDGFAAIAEGESPLKRIGTILKGLVARLLAAAAAAMLAWCIFRWCRWWFKIIKKFRWYQRVVCIFFRY